MKTTILLLASLALVPLPALAQETTIIHKETTMTPAVPVVPDSSVTIHTETDTTGAVTDCRTKTVRTEDSMGNSETRTRTNCP